MIELIIYLIVLIALAIGSYTDFKVREVPDWISYGMIFIGLGIRGIFSIAYWDYTYFLSGIFGFLIFLALALIMFYAGQWGGGDSKMLMGLGALLGVEFNQNTFMLGFFINLVIVGAIYGLIFSAILVVKNRKKFSKEFVRLFIEEKKQKIIFFISSAIILIFSLFVPYYIQMPIITIGLLIFISFFIRLFLKATEISCMYKLVEPEQLTEGDWIVKDVVIDDKRICGPKDLGIEMSQIKQLIKLKNQKKIEKILIKEGIPFVPSFLLAFIFTYFFGNWLFVIIGLI